MTQLMTRVRQQLNIPVDGASLAIFRILFGLLLAFAMIRFLANGWIAEFFIKPTLFFPYDWFPWVKPLPPSAMYALFVLLTVLALCVAAGFCYRISIALFLIGFTYVELIDKTSYLNHYYLITLLCGLMCWLPAHRVGSMDAWLQPRAHSETVPRWSVAILRFQFGAVYVFAGLAKLTPDWLYSAQPLRTWLAARDDLPMVGPWLDDAWVAYTASWIGTVFDLAVVPLLLHRRTRPWAFGAVIGFHVATWILFRIGIFPWLMILGALLFFPPDWPRRCRKPGQRQNSLGFRSSSIRPLSRWALGLLAIYVSIQIALPLRSMVQAEPSGWTGRGFNWSWRVMLVEKSGFVEFRAMDPTTGFRQRIRALDYVTPRQAHFVAQDPGMIRALARHIAIDLRRQGHDKIEVYADAYASLNGRRVQRLIEPNVELSGFVPPKWIVALQDEGVRNPAR